MISMRVKPRERASECGHAGVERRPEALMGVFMGVFM
jgi:hypothetical protein